MMKKLATGIALALISSPALAEIDSGFYAGVGIGEATVKDTAAGLDIDASDTGYKMFGGYRFNEYGSIEAGYLVGTFDETISGVEIESDANAFQASLLWQVPVSNYFELYLRGSIVAWEADHTATVGSATFRQDTDGTDFGYGIGAAVNATPKFGMRAEFEGAEFDGTDFRMISVSGLFRF